MGVLFSLDACGGGVGGGVGGGAEFILSNHFHNFAYER